MGMDWLTFDVLQLTRDKVLQESVSSIDPTLRVIVFVFLPSQSGKSIAIWRRKLNVPNDVRAELFPQIRETVSHLRRREDYIVHVDRCVHILLHAMPTN
jgi:hypothetical protein